jgi:hypothetical protein
VKGVVHCEEDDRVTRFGSPLDAEADSIFNDHGVRLGGADNVTDELEGTNTAWRNSGK